jgi:hypothetical protein
MADHVKSAIEAIATAAAKRVKSDDEVKAWEANNLRLQIDTADNLRRDWGVEAGIPGRLLDVIADGHLDTSWPPINFVITSIDRGDLVIGITGVPRSGKTQAACYGLWYHKRKKDIAKIKHPHGLGATTGGKYTTAVTYVNLHSSRREVLAACPILVVDNMGREHPSKQQLVEELVLTRADEGLCTIFTCSEGAAIGWDDHLRSRLDADGALAAFKEPYQCRRSVGQ